MKLKEQLHQIEKRIAELRRKADWIKSQLGDTEPAVEAIQEAQEAINALPRRRGRRKLNEAE